MIRNVRYKMDFYILHTLLLEAILLFMMQNIGQNKEYWRTNKIKMEKNNELKRFVIKNRTCYFFNDIIKVKDFNFDIFS